MQTIELSKRELALGVGLVGLAPLLIMTAGLTLTIALLAKEPGTTGQQVGQATPLEGLETETGANSTLIGPEAGKAPEENLAAMPLGEAEIMAGKAEPLAMPFNDEYTGVADAPVVIESTKEEEPPQTAAPTADQGFTIQVGFFGNSENAAGQLKRLKAEGMAVRRSALELEDGSSGIALLSGYFSSRSEAEQAGERIAREHQLDAWVQPVSRYERKAALAMF